MIVASLSCLVCVVDGSVCVCMFEQSGNEQTMVILCGVGRKLRLSRVRSWYCEACDNVYLSHRWWGIVLCGMGCVVQCGDGAPCRLGLLNGPWVNRGCG